MTAKNKNTKTEEEAKAKAEEEAKAKDEESKDSKLIAMSYGTMEISVDPSCVAAHEAKGWEIKD